MELPSKFKFVINTSTYSASVNGVWVAVTEDDVLQTNVALHNAKTYVASGFWKIIEDTPANGIDASGKPLHMTEAMLKPFQRVKTQNGSMWIASINVQADDSLALVAKDSWNEAHIEAAPGYDEGYNIVAVYDVPEYNCELLDPKKHGKLLWQYNNKPASAAKLQEKMDKLVQERSEEEGKLRNINAEITNVCYQLRTLKGE